MDFVSRPFLARPNFRPETARSRKPDVRVRSATAPAPTVQTSGFPLWCAPLLIAAAAMPIYGYQKQSKEIAEARARYEASKGAPKPAVAKK
ncbi:hypothetical protein HYH03_015481 [Edaphochlamys debaryana]|uniref:Uncharacterized protein n=1 Tax=Edaphochlamys debaryana TaxID=47281 RepID=A0A835XM01_9CHLO|nr:hypothetical protein HYH03_015481 [Edaphochlamys debaryana]|eukprot:KAG2485767.1 hypothetical protein HYH03_015481 [Edaphochlamys debaryana]